MKAPEFKLTLLREIDEPNRRVIYIPPVLTIIKSRRPCLVYQDLTLGYKRDDILVLAAEIDSIRGLFYEVLTENIEPPKQTKRLLREYIRAVTEGRKVHTETPSSLEKELQPLFHDTRN